MFTSIVLATMLASSGRRLPAWGQTNISTCGQCKEDQCKALSLRCRSGELISAVKTASFGASREGSCKGGGLGGFKPDQGCTPAQCVTEKVTEVARAACLGKASCSVPNNWRLFWPDP